MRTLINRRRVSTASAALFLIFAVGACGAVYLREDVRIDEKQVGIAESSCAADDLGHGDSVMNVGAPGVSEECSPVFRCVATRDSE